MTTEPALHIIGRQVAADLGLWVLHVTRTHPRLSDVIGWARMQAMLTLAADLSPKRALRAKAESKAWLRMAAWLEQMDPQQYPQQVQAVIDAVSDKGRRGRWRGRHSPQPPMQRADIIGTRNARPLPN